MLGPRARVTAAPSLRGQKCVGGDHRELSVGIRCCRCEDVTHRALWARIHRVNLVTRIMAEQTESGSENIVSNLSDKSRSLRKTSVKKRLETEMKKVTKKRKEKYPKKPRLNKYQRKVANAKERERMKRMNEVFERLKKHVPMEQLNSDDGKDKKVFFIYHFSLVQNVTGPRSLRDLLNTGPHTAITGQISRS